MNREHRERIETRADLRSKDLAGKPLPTARDRDIRNAAARREIERRRMEKEAKE